MNEKLLDIIALFKSNGFNAELSENQIRVKLIAYNEQFDNLSNLLKLWAKDKNISCVVTTNELEESDHAWQYQESQEYTCVFSFYPSDKWKMNIEIV